MTGELLYEQKLALMNHGCMLDTNIFNRLIKDGSPGIEVFKDVRLFATHIQLDELKETKCPIRKNKLLQKFQEISPQVITTETLILGISKLGLAKLSDEDGFYERLKARIMELDKAAKKKPKNETNQPSDALIAETAIKNNLTLITDDGTLKQATVEFGGRANTLNEILKLS